MTYKEFISKLEEYSFCMLNFEKGSKEFLILYIESELPIAALSLVDDDWKFIDQSALFDATWLGTMAEMSELVKGKRTSHDNMGK